MASKLQYIYELSENVSRNLSGYENWTAFLKSAAWQYNQIIIIEQWFTHPHKNNSIDFFSK